jgi:signal peptidase I
MTDSSNNHLARLPKKLVTETWLKTYEIKGTGWLRLLSGSMAPLINTGDQVLIEKIVPSEISIGDIITFWRGDILVTHRVIRKFSRQQHVYFIERADTSLQHYEVVSDAVIGRVIKIRKGEDHEIIFNTLSWRLFNRLVGIGFLASSSAYDLGNKIRWVPRPLRRCIAKIFVAAKYVQQKMLSDKMNNM